jgi:UDPglucose 6-dehydrogenase
LSQLGVKSGVPTYVVSGVKKSNDAHRGWAARRLRELIGDLAGSRIAVWGLTYKPGTDTLRRSSAVELCDWLIKQNALVSAHDPAVKALPDSLRAVRLCDDALVAAEGADALVLMTEWPEYRNICADAIHSALRGRHVLDPNRFLVQELGGRSDIVYVTVGQAV